MSVRLSTRSVATAAVMAAVAVVMAPTGTAVAAPAVSSVAAVAEDPSPSPSTSPSAPTEEDVEEAKRAAEEAEAEVAAITAAVEQAEQRLQALQRRVSESVGAQQKAEQQLRDADAAVARATADLDTARQARAAADRVLSDRAATMYMQGGEFENLTRLVVSPPNVMADLVVVLDHNAAKVRTSLDAATSTADAAADQEKRLSAARDARAAAVTEAERTRVAAEKDATEAGTEAAKLAEQQEKLSERLEQLNQEAEDLVAERKAAAEREEAARKKAEAEAEEARALGPRILGMQAATSSGGKGPAAAQAIARSMMPAFGWDDGEFGCLVTLWHNESGWSWSATNPSSGAYGIPQSLPAWKMASAGSDWLTNPATQIAWGLDYIDSVYGSPCNALAKFNSRSPHWY